MKAAAIVLFILSSTFSTAQDVESLISITSMDSLLSSEAFLNNSDTRKDSLLTAWHFNQGQRSKERADPEATWFHFNSAHALAEKRSFEKLLVSVKLEMSDRLKVQRKTDSASLLIRQSMEIAENLEDKSFLGLTHYQKGSFIDEVEENPIEAIKEYFLALSIFEELADTSGMALVHMNLGSLYVTDDNPLEALHHYRMSESLYEKIGVIKQRVRLGINIGLTYHRMNVMDSAILSFKSVEPLIENKTGLASAFLNINLGNSLIQIGEHVEALERLKVANGIFRRIDDKFGIGITEYHMGEALLRGGEYQKAVDALEKVLLLIDEYGINNMRETVHKDLSLAYANSGNYTQAYGHAKEAIILQDSLEKVESRKQLGLLQQKYELTKKEAENERLKRESAAQEAAIKRQQDLIMFVFLASLALSGFAAFYFRSQQKTKRLYDTISKQSDKLQAINEAKSHLFANISHDFRTPLTLISGQVHLLLDDYLDLLPADAISRLHKISWNNNRLISLTEEIRELISLDSGNIKLDMKAQDMRSFLALQVGLFQSAAEEKGIEMTLSLTENQANTEMDPSKLEKVFYNLLSNALKFTPEGGSIKVSLTTNNQTICIELADSGIGIDSKHFEHVFDRYYQIESSDYKVQQGLGIGLAITKELIDLHGGSIKVSSEIGVGTTFSLTLPLTEKPILEQVNPLIPLPINLEKESKSDTVKDHKKAGTVLIVDDHPQIRGYIRDILSSDFNTLEAENGWVALETLRKEKVNLIITDIMMPVMDGFVLIESLKKDEKLKKLPILAVSARSGQEDKERVLGLGVSDYMIKPFNSKEFKLRIKNLVETQLKNLELPEAIQNYNLEKLEEEWLSKLSEVIIKNIDLRINNNMLASELAMSERTLYRALKDITGLTPLEYIKQVKFQHARKLLSAGKVKSLNDAGKAIGIQNVTRFKSQYKAYYDEEPVARQ